MADIEKLRARFKELRSHRSPFESRYRRLAKYILPDSGRFEVSDNALLDDRWKFVYDATATDAAGALAAGLLAGITSPARPWFRLTTGDPEQDENYQNREWLSDVTDRIQRMFLSSNVYPALIQCYEEMAVFGTACVVMRPSETEDIHLFPMTIGEYWIAEDYENRVTTLFRRFSMTAEQMVRMFGRDRVSRPVREAYNSKENRFKQFSVIHAIYPRDRFDPEKADNLNMPFASVYFEEGYPEGEDRILLEEGFRTFPALCPRWQIQGGTAYGTSPGMKALREVMSLQICAKREQEGINETTNPAMIYPASMENHRLDFAPGGISFYADGANPQQAVPAKAVNFNLQHLEAAIQAKQKKIESYFYKDLFAAIMSTPRTNRTAYEVDQVSQERMSLLGPVLQRLNTELLRPLISMGLYCLERAGRLPPMPEGMQGVTVTFESILVQALRSAGITAEDRYLSTAFSIANFDSSVIDNIDLDRLMQKRGLSSGIDPDIMRSPEDVEAIRQARAEAQQQAQQLAQAQQMSEVAKNLQGLNPQMSKVGTISQNQGY